MQGAGAVVEGRVAFFVAAEGSERVLDGRFEGDFAMVGHQSSKGDGHFAVLFTGGPHGDFHVLPQRGEEFH